MLKTTLYTAVAGGFLAAVTFTAPVIAAPVAPSVPAVEKNVTDVQHRHSRRHRHHRHRHHHRGHHHHDHGYYSPWPSLFFFGPRHHHHW